MVKSDGRQVPSDVPVVSVLTLYTVAQGQPGRYKSPFKERKEGEYEGGKEGNA